eukprot:1160616-Pelagomonas_calceolata.AAC.10
MAPVLAESIHVSVDQLPYAERVFGILREKNPELTGERRRTVLKPPQRMATKLARQQCSCKACGHHEPPDIESDCNTPSHHLMSSGARNPPDSR